MSKDFDLTRLCEAKPAPVSPGDAKMHVNASDQRPKGRSAASADQWTPDGVCAAGDGASVRPRETTGRHLPRSGREQAAWSLLMTAWSRTQLRQRRQKRKSQAPLQS